MQWTGDGGARTGENVEREGAKTTSNQRGQGDIIGNDPPPPAQPLPPYPAIETRTSALAEPIDRKGKGHAEL